MKSKKRHPKPYELEHKKFLAALSEKLVPMRATKKERKKYFLEEYREKFDAGRKFQPEIDDNGFIKRHSALEDTKSLTAVHGILSQQKETYEDDGMNRREAAARKEAEQKAKRIHPVWNKGGYQFVTDGMIDSNLGKKV